MLLGAVATGSPQEQELTVPASLLPPSIMLPEPGKRARDSQHPGERGRSCPVFTAQDSQQDALCLPLHLTLRSSGLMSQKALHGPLGPSAARDHGKAPCRASDLCSAIYLPVAGSVEVTPQAPGAEGLGFNPCSTASWLGDGGSAAAPPKPPSSSTK